MPLVAATCPPSISQLYFHFVVYCCANLGDDHFNKVHCATTLTVLWVALDPL